jgi:hypothetical protein
MGIPHYSQGYPPDGSSLGNTKTVIRGNLDGTFLTLGIDHVNNNGSPGSNPAGYHTIIHQVTQAAPPANIVGVNQVFALVPPSGIPDAVNPQLFNLTNSVLSQMTGGNPANNGYTWFAGFLIQWGIFKFTTVSGHEAGVVTLATSNVNFPNNNFVVIPQLQVNNSSVNTNSNTIAINAKGLTTFEYVFNSSSSTGTSQYPGFYWIAIGN